MKRDSDHIEIEGENGFCFGFYYVDTHTVTAMITKNSRGIMGFEFTNKKDLIKMKEWLEVIIDDWDEGM
jgi:hypothetical protein